MTITIFVGDSDESISKNARKHDQSAYLVDFSNFEEFLKTNFVKDVTIYTAHSDLPKITKERAVLYEVLNKADIIYYSPPEHWADQSTDFFSVTSQKSLTLYFLSLIGAQKNNIIGLDLTEYINNQYISLRSIEHTSGVKIWNAGCSIANGVGVDRQQRYINLISTTTDIPVVDLSLGGSSIEYAADQLLRSNIERNDIVIWGLTEETRFPVWCSNLKTVGAGKHNIETFTETRLYKAVTSVHQVSSFCSKIGARLILLPIICSENFCLMLSGLPDFYQPPYQTRPTDYGNDNLHPGPLQHKIYADFLLNIIQSVPDQ